jgi:2'-5' RNA ligase
MHKLRTFVAVELSPDVRARASDMIRKLSPSGVKASWVKPENMHLTLKFLGDTPTSDLAGVCQAVAEAATAVPSFDIECAGAGAFPSLNRPRTLWLGLHDGEGKLQVLHRAVEDALAKVGFRPEHRRFQPHLTIGRVRQSTPAALAELSRLIAENAHYPPAVSDVSEIVVFSSQLEADGPIHEVVGHAELATGDAL